MKILRINISFEFETLIVLQILYQIYSLNFSIGYINRTDLQSKVLNFLIWKWENKCIYFYLRFSISTHKINSTNYGPLGILSHFRQRKIYAYIYSWRILQTHSSLICENLKRGENYDICSFWNVLLRDGDRDIDNRPVYLAHLLGGQQRACDVHMRWEKDWSLQSVFF